MKLAADLHIHSIGSGHAYSTILEIAAAAKAKGLPLVAITDHGPFLPDGPHPAYFSNLRVLPPEIDGVRVLKGVEANIVNEHGGLDLEARFLERLDIVLAGFHTHCLDDPDAGPDAYTKAILKAMDNPFVDILVHPGNPQFPLDYERVVRVAAEKGIPLEINNSSFRGSRIGSTENCHEIARLVAASGGPLVISSDAHIALDVGRFDHALEVVSEAGVKDEQILNTSAEKVLAYLKQRREKRRASLG